jgi:hypothetical protein
MANDTPLPADQPVSTPEKTLAEVMYPTPTEPASEPAPPAIEAVTVDELVAQDLPQGGALYADGGERPADPAGYDSKLGDGFNALEYEARYDGNAEHVQALADGRRDTAAVLHELQVPIEQAGELTRSLTEWHQREPQDEDTLQARQDDTRAQLQQLWGRETEARIALAQKTAIEACKRLPWLAPLLAKGAGNDPALIKRFAEIGLRQARRNFQSGKK